MFGRICSSKRFRCGIAAVLLVGVVLVLLGVWYIRVSRFRAVTRIRANDLDIVMAALTWYDEDEHHLPPATQVDREGHPLNSWRFRVAPWLDSIFGGLHFEAKWDDPVNRKWEKMSPLCYCLSKQAQVDRETNIVAVAGPGTAFDPAREIRLSDIPADTILLVEIADSGIHWMQPGDLSIDKVQPAITSGVDGFGVHVGFADGFVWFLRPEVPVDVLKKFFTIEGARRNSRDVLLRPYLIDEYEGHWHRCNRERIKGNI
jgi:hypothetical protein